MQQLTHLHANDTFCLPTIPCAGEVIHDGACFCAWHEFSVGIHGLDIECGSDVGSLLFSTRIRASPLDLRCFSCEP